MCECLHFIAFVDAHNGVENVDKGLDFVVLCSFKNNPLAKPKTLLPADITLEALE